MKYPGTFKTKRPKMSEHAGRTWDCWDLILPDGLVSECWLDTTRGEYFYFRTVEIDENGKEYHQWRSGPLDKFHNGQECTIDLWSLTK